MELSDYSVIEALLAAANQPKRAAGHNRNQGVETASVRTAKQRRCACGKCVSCLDNARWERIFNEKFADPFYYQRNPVGFSSPLA